MMIFIGTLFCNLHRDANGLHLRQTKFGLSRGLIFFWCENFFDIAVFPLSGSAWARNLGEPLSDLRLLGGSIDGLRGLHPLGEPSAPSRTWVGQGGGSRAGRLRWMGVERQLRVLGIRVVEITTGRLILNGGGRLLELGFGCKGFQC